jgi:hypothetical protein
MKQQEYTEDPETLENFKRLATTVLRATKRGKRKDKPAASPRKEKSSGKDWKGISCPVPVGDEWSESAPLPVSSL